MAGMTIYGLIVLTTHQSGALCISIGGFKEGSKAHSLQGVYEHSGSDFDLCKWKES